MISHLNYLHEKIFELKQLEINNLSEPTLFEYYSAVFLTNHYNQPFYLWKDLSPLQKQNFNLPCRDKGVDISNCSFTILGQSKYYSKNSTVTYGKLSTFLAFDKLNPSIKNIDFCLLRLTESNISSEVSQMISYKTLKDFPIEKDVFMSYITSIPPPVYPDKIIIEKQFRSYQQEADNSIISSRLNNKNCIISIPTGGGKTHVTIQYCKKTTGCFLILVPTIILMNQWAEESIKEGITSNSIYKIGTGNNKTISTKNINKYKLVICVYNSFIKIPKTCIDVLASIFVDEAHRIIKPNIYKEEEEADSKEEDESYIKEIQKSIADNNKFILLSATIDNCKGFEYFNYPIRSAIDEGFLSDYQLICPIFNEDPTNKNIAEYIIKKGEAHCIIYTNSIEECERFTGVLNSLLPNCARCVHSDMNNTQVILNSYNKGEFRFLVNVKILVEGFDSPVSSSVLFLHLSSSKTFMIQCIGRILRLHPTKKIANVYMPCSTEENTKDIRSFIKQLTEYDYKFKEAAQEKKIGTYINFEECIEEKGSEKKNDDENLYGELKEDIQHKYDIIYDSLGVDFRVNLLLEFVDQNNRTPKCEEIYKGIKIGQFWNSIKQGNHNNLYKLFLEKNEILKIEYERLIKNREGKEVITPDQKCNLLIEFVNQNNRSPKFEEIYKETKIGHFFSSIKQGLNNNLYKLYLEKNEILKIEYERVKLLKEEKKGKEIITPEQKCNLLLEFVSIENRQPAHIDIYKKVKIGMFWNNIKQRNNNNLYMKYLETNVILRESYERVKKLKDKEIITPEQKCFMLLEFINVEKRLPTQNEIYKNVKLGTFWDGIKQGHHTNLYKKYLEPNVILKIDYEKVQQVKEEKKGKEVITPDQKCNLLLEFADKNNRLPKCEEIYKHLKLGTFWDGIKQGHHTNLYKKYLEPNVMLKIDYEKVQQVKEEKKGKEIITADQKCNLLLEFVSIENRQPAHIDIYKEVKIGLFWHNIKTGQCNNLYKKYLEPNVILKIDYEKVQQVKEEKKGKEIITPDQKCNLLLEFVNQINRSPKSEEIYKDVKLGTFWNGIKQGHHTNLYKKYLEPNVMLKIDYERVYQVKEEKKGKEIITPDQKCNLLLEFVSIENRQPANLEIYKDIKVGIFWSNIKKGQINNLYKKYLEPNVILRKDYERVHQVKEEKKDNEVITQDQKSNLLIEFINENNKVPKATEIYKEIKIGQFWNSIKQGCSNNLYKKYLEQNEILRKDYERVKKNKEEKKGKEIITPEQKCFMLLEFINVENRLPTQLELYKGLKIGTFWDGIKQGHHTNLYKKYLEPNVMLKIDYERVQQVKEEKKGKEIITADQKCNLLIEFVSVENRPPKFKEIYKEIKVGGFWNNIKQRQYYNNYYNNLYKQCLEKNEILRKDYKRYQKNKEENK